MKAQVLVYRIKYVRPDLIRTRKDQMVEAVKSANCQRNIVMGCPLLDAYYRTEQPDEHTVRLLLWTRTRWWQWLLRLFWLPTHRAANSRRIAIEAQAVIEHIIARNPATAELQRDRE